jgi:transporter family protein
MRGGWLVPALGYMLVVGVSGITAKFALRQVTWQGLLAITTAGYFSVLVVLLATGQQFRANNPHGNPTLDWSMTAVNMFIPSVGIILFWIALGQGDASRVVPVSSAYPLLTVILAALFLSEALTWQVGIGAVLIVSGVILISA